MTAPIDATYDATAPHPIGRRWISIVKIDAITIVSTVILLLLAVLVLPPVFILIYGSFTVPPPGKEYSGVTIANFTSRSSKAVGCLPASQIR